MQDNKEIYKIQEIVRENSSIMEQVKDIVEEEQEIKMLEKSNKEIIDYNSKIKSRNSKKTALRKTIEGSSAYNKLTNSLANKYQNETVFISEGFSITVYLKEDLDKQAIIKHYEKQDLLLPVIEKTISKFNI